MEQGLLVGSSREAPDWEKTRNGFAHVTGSVLGDDQLHGVIVPAHALVRIFL